MCVEHAVYSRRTSDTTPPVDLVCDQLHLADEDDRQLARGCDGVHCGQARRQQRGPVGDQRAPLGRAHGVAHRPRRRPRRQCRSKGQRT